MNARVFIAEVLAAFFAAALLIAPLSLALAEAGAWGAGTAALLHGHDHGHDHEVEGAGDDEAGGSAAEAHAGIDHEHQNPAILPRPHQERPAAPARRRAASFRRGAGTRAGRVRRPPRGGAA